MAAFEALLLMLGLAVALLAVSRRLHLPYPALLALVGALIAVSPIKVELRLDPDLVLALFVAPVLLDAAYDVSFRDLKRNWAAVSSLALIAVGLTTVAVACVVHALIPTLPWAAAIAIGAIVAPPDAIAATTVLSQVPMPHRVRTILEGEALLNDASTLLIYRLSVAAVATGGEIGAGAIAPAFLWSVLGSLVVGPALAWIGGRVIALIEDVPSSILLQFVSTFGVWVLAERIGLSPILTVVVYAIVLARGPGARQRARLRVPSFAVWETVVVVLNVVAFLLIGLELGPVIEGARPGELGRWVMLGVAVLATVILVRLMWTIGAALWQAWAIRRSLVATRSGGDVPTWKTGLVIGWAGARGIVTIATALALPSDFPERGALLFTALAVTLGTLIIQGFTLRPLVLALRLPGDDVVEAELRAARAETAEAALRAIAGDEHAEAEFLRAELRAERDLAVSAGTGDGRPTLPRKTLLSQVVLARRERLLGLRAEGTIGDETFHRLEEEFDRVELAVAART